MTIRTSDNAPKKQFIAFIFVFLLALAAGAFTYWFTQLRGAPVAERTPQPSPRSASGASNGGEKPSIRDKLNEHRTDGTIEDPKPSRGERRHSGDNISIQPGLALDLELCAGPSTAPRICA